MLRAGDTAPEFQIKSLKDGQLFDLKSELAKGPLMIVFLKESCPTCRMALPLLDRAYKQFSGPRGQMLFVLQEMPWAAAQLLEELGVSAPAYLDEEPYPVSDSFGIDFVPSAFYIQADGTIAAASASFDRQKMAAMCENLALSNGFETDPFLESEDVPRFQVGCGAKNSA